MAYLLIRSQVLIQGFATDSEFTSKLGLLLASLDTLAQFGNTLRRQGFLPATVSPALLGERNTLALTLADQGALELGERAHHREHQVRHRRVFASKTEVFLDEFDMHAALCQRLHDPAQIIEIARQAIHAMHHHGVAGAGEAYQRFQLRTLDILAGCLVAKARSTLTPSSCRSGFWSKVLTLIYPMRCPVMEFPAKCQGRLYDLQRDMSINSKFNPILTQLHMASDIRLGYAST